MAPQACGQIATPPRSTPLTDLARFVDAQSRMHARALAELRAGEKESHWMWFVFPQLRGLGFSPTATHYGIRDLGEAGAFLAHPLLGPRLREATDTVLAQPDRPLRGIFGTPDDLKFRSCMTLFERAAPGEPRFGQALDLFCGGERDPRTLALLERPR